jgi:hypothetical protein
VPRALPLLQFLLLAACGATPTADATSPDEDPSATPKRRGGSELSMEADVGAMNEAQVNEAFNKASPRMLECLGKSSVPAASGVVRVVVHVDASGSAVKSFLKKSTVGDRTAEECILAAVRGRSWPAPVGGKVGIAESELAFEPPSGVRAPIDWSESDAGKNVGAAREVLSSCRSNASAGPLSATLIVETDGSVASVGVAGDDEASEKAAPCVVEGLKAIKLNSPGSFAAKLTLAPR